MFSYFELNVSLDGKHLFATAPRSATTEHEHREIMKHFRDKFPVNEGFAINSTYYKVERITVPVRA